MKDLNMQFIDLKAQQSLLKYEIDAVIQKVLSHGQYILGPEVFEFEETLAKFVDVSFALTCANGTDALMLSLMALGIGLGDAVFCPSFTFPATAESIAILGATPIFVDINRDSYNMCPESLRRTIENISSNGEMQPRAIIVVDLFGQLANYPEIVPIAHEHGLKIISDSAQGFGATLNGKHPNFWADIMTTSFFPAKPLGCYGDGGAVFTDNAELKMILDSLRVHGRGKNKFDNIRIGLNSRLDTLQAAILLAKIKVFPDEIKARNQIASRYSENLKSNNIKIPFLIEGALSTWAQFTIEVEDPILLASKLNSNGIPTARYYPKPTHLQSAYVKFPKDPQGLGNTETVMHKVISLPMHPYLDEQIQTSITEKIQRSLE